MKHILLFALLLAGCQFESDCHQHVRDLYPNQDIKVIEVSDEISVYILKDQYVTCDCGHSILVVNTVTPVPWVEAYCGHMTDPKGCLEKKRKKPAEKEEP
jgi:hypothetical protein